MKETDFSNPNKRRQLTKKEKDNIRTYLVLDLKDRWLCDKLKTSRMSALCMVRNYAKELVQQHD